LKKYKGKDVSGSVVYGSKLMLEDWFAQRSRRPKDLFDGFCVTAVHEKEPGVLTAILQERPVPDQPKGFTLMDLKDQEDLYDRKWESAEKVPFLKLMRARRRLKRTMTRTEKDVMYYCGLAVAKNTWYYMDRAGTSRGPCNLPLLRDAWTKGIIDGDTLVWGTGMHFWAPLRNVTGLAPQIRTSDVKLVSGLQKFFLRQRYKRVRRLREKAGKRFSDMGRKQVESMV